MEKLKQQLKERIKKSYFGLYTYKWIKYLSSKLQCFFVDRLPDEEFIKRKYKKEFGRDINLIAPVRFSEKLQWLKLYKYTPLHTRCADKIAVKDYVKEIIGEHVLIPTILVTKRYADINSRKISSDKFAVKPNHSSGDIVLCTDRSIFNWNHCRICLKFWLKTNYYKSNRERQYRDIKRGIIVEELLENKQGGDLMDYKLFVFNGKVKIVQVDSDRFADHKRSLFDTDWQALKVKYDYENITKEVPRPKSFPEMITMAETLARPFKFVRVDFYEVDGRPYFGEMTFHPDAGFVKLTPETFDEELGEWLSVK